MHLIRDDIITNMESAVNAFCLAYDIPRDRLYETTYWSNHLPRGTTLDYSMAIDFGVTELVARHSQTFVFDQKQILAFVADVDRQLPPGDYPAPYECMIFQFSEGIDEKLLTTGAYETGAEASDDRIAGLLLAMPAEGISMGNVIAWYQSTAINRIAYGIGGDGEVINDTMTRSDDPVLNAVLRADKQRILNLALLCLAYINSPSTEVEHVAADPAVNRKRAAKGKRELPDYYICRVRRTERAGQEDSVPSNRHVSFKFPVRGHFRRFDDGRIIWIPQHYRGLAHGDESMKPKIYRVD